MRQESKKVFHKKVSDNKSFNITFQDVEKPFTLILTPERPFLDHREFLLFEGFTSKYYRGYCGNYYTMPMTTYLIEPRTETVVELSKISRFGETQITFNNRNAYSSSYYQETFDLDQSFDEALSMSNTVSEAIENMSLKQKELLELLEQEKEFISPFLYRYTEAEINFGAKKEFLRYILLDHPEIMSELSAEGAPNEIQRIIEFQKERIDHATLISKEYNEFIELYMNFNYSLKKKKFILYQEFDKGKYEFALDVLPKETGIYT